jgi:hypothetical protein
VKAWSAQRYRCVARDQHCDQNLSDRSGHIESSIKPSKVQREGRWNDEKRLVEISLPGAMGFVEGAEGRLNLS